MMMMMMMMMMAMMMVLNDEDSRDSSDVGEIEMKEPSRMCTNRRALKRLTRKWKKRVPKMMERVRQ